MHIYRKYHISKKKKYIFGKRDIPSFQILQKRSYSSAIFLERLFSEHLKKTSYFHVFFFEKDHLFFFHLKNKIMFSGKRSIIFPDNTSWIIFQCNFIGKTIFSEHLEKKNLFFFAVLSSPDSTVLSCFFFFFFIIVLYLLIQWFNNFLFLQNL